VCALSEIVMAPNQKFTVPLLGQGERVHQHDWGSLTITAEEMVKSKSLVEIVVRCAELDNKDLFSKSDPFLRISRLQEDGSATSVYRTEVKKNNLNPTWKPIRINLQQLCNGDMVRTLTIFLHTVGFKLFHLLQENQKCDDFCVTKETRAIKTSYFIQ
jgi:hypothetical protein